MGYNVLDLRRFCVSSQADGVEPLGTGQEVTVSQREIGLLPAPLQSRVTCEFCVGLHNSHRVTDLIISNVRGRLAELLTGLVVKLRQIHGRDRSLLSTSFYLVEVLLYSRVRDKVERNDPGIE